MSYRLVIAEKPSVGAAYAKVLGATNRQDGYWEGDGYLVSWCIGHLVELAPPNVYDEKFVKWSVADLPILPQKWEYLVSAGTKKQFGILQKLMHRPDVDSVICATDAGREGELIFRLVYQQAGCKKPFSRLWLSSMEESAIREGFAHLKPSTEYDALYNAALCRERADIGLSYRLLDNENHAKGKTLRNIWLGIDCLNLFGISNVNSYYWITDVTNQQYAVPNYLTGRLINAKVTFEF